jgi:3-hydroxybutyryl-CoA dehydratase
MTPQVGDTLPTFVIDSVSAAAMKEWAVFLADPNPIHLDAAVVKAKGLGDRVINQGPANVAYLMNMLMQAFPQGAITAMESRFVDNVYAEDELTAGGSVTAVVDGVVSCEIWLRAAARDAVITGTARVKLQA